MGILVVPLATLNAIAWTLFAVSALLTFGRFYIRWTKARRLYLDDFFNAAALASLLVFISTYQVYFPPSYQEELYYLGLGGYIPSDEVQEFDNTINEVNVTFFWVTIYCVKAAFLSLYWTIFGVNKKFRSAWAVVTGYTMVSYLITFLAFFWRCGNPNQLDSAEACDAVTQQQVTNEVVLWNVLNVVGDLATMFLPMWMIRDLRISTAQKLGVAVISGLVIIDIVFDILRTVFTIGDYSSSLPNANAVWALCEPTIAVMVCAMPTYGSLLSRKKKPSPTSYDNMPRANSTGASENSRKGLVPQ